MKERLKKLHAVKATADALTDKVAELTVKADSLRRSLESLQVSTMEKVAAKDNTLDKFVRGEVSQTEVDQAREACDQAQNDLRDTENLLAATERVLGEFKGNLPDLLNKVTMSERELWTALYERERADIIKAVGDKFWRCYAAKGLMRITINPAILANEIFGFLDVKKIQNLSNELKREFLG